MFNHKQAISDRLVYRNDSKFNVSSNLETTPCCTCTNKELFTNIKSAAQNCIKFRFLVVIEFSMMNILKIQ